MKPGVQETHAGTASGGPGSVPSHGTAGPGGGAWVGNRSQTASRLAEGGPGGAGPERAEETRGAGPPVGAPGSPPALALGSEPGAGKEVGLSLILDP